MTLYIEAGFDLEVICGALGSSLSFNLVETGGSGASGPISMNAGQFFLRTDGTTVTKPDGETAYALGYSAFTTALKAALEAVGVCTYTVSFDPSTQRLSITAAPGVTGVTSFAINTYSIVTQRVLGFTTNRAGALTYVADRAPWYWLKCTQGGLNDFFWDREAPAEIAEDLKSHGAEVYGLHQDEVPILFDAWVPLEPRAVVWNRFASATVPFTWQRFFRHARNRASGRPRIGGSTPICRCADG